jgi:hypothetical protein
VRWERYNGEPFARRIDERKVHVHPMGAHNQALDFFRIPSRSFPEKRSHEISHSKRRADAASGASPVSAFEADALTAMGEKSGEEVEIPRRARC